MRGEVEEEEARDGEWCDVCVVSMCARAVVERWKMALRVALESCACVVSFVVAGWRVV